MAASKEIVAASYDAIRDRVAGGEDVGQAIGAEVPASGIAPATLRAAYFRLAREKGHTKPREPKPALDIEAFRARFDTAVAEREARRRSDFATVVEQLGDHLRAVAGRHPPSWVRTAIVASGVSVSKDEFTSWLRDVVDSASRKQKSPKVSQDAENGPVATGAGDGRADPVGKGDVATPATGDAVAERGPAIPPKPPRPKIRGTQDR